MTYRQYLETCNDEFEKAIIIANLARKHPKYDSYSARRRKEVQKELLDSEMPIAESEKHERRFMVEEDKENKNESLHES